MVTPAEATELELEPGHPGLGDEGYIERRRELFALCRRHRLERLGPPLVEYTPEETRIWREVSPKLDELHVKHACQIYLEAKRELAITQTRSRSCGTLSQRVERETNMHLVPAEGALPTASSIKYIGDRGFPVTQFIRHGSHPEFTPEPDMIHDCLGHVPPLMNQDYAELLTLIGKAASTTHERRARAGAEAIQLVQHRVRPDRGSRARRRSSAAASCPRPARFPYSLFSTEVTREPFVTDTVINTDYDPSRMQDHLFIAPSLPFLRRELEALVRRFGL